MNETPRRGGLLYFIILMVFYWVILIPIFATDDSDVKRQFLWGCFLQAGRAQGSVVRDKSLLAALDVLES